MTITNEMLFAVTVVALIVIIVVVHLRHDDSW